MKESKSECNDKVISQIVINDLVSGGKLYILTREISETVEFRFGKKSGLEENVEKSTNS